MHVVYIDARFYVEFFASPRMTTYENWMTRIGHRQECLLPLGVLRFHFGADFFRSFHYAERVFAEDLSDIRVGVAFAHQGFGDFREPGGVFKAFGHVGTVEIGTQANVVGADEFYGVVDVLDDLLPSDVWEFAFDG